MLAQDVSWARSIIVVAIPRPVLEVVFTVDGKKRSTVIPPPYEYGIDGLVTAAIESELTPRGHRILWAMLPVKLLAVCSGLARYGKNNIAYVEGMGSFLRFNAFYSDLPPVSDTWQEPQVLDECTNCSACIKNCPTGAIDPDRFQLRVERCLTYHNESSEPFPSWIQESWHHCLVGCLKCQRYCPVNKTVRSWTERSAEFTDTETTLLLSGAAKGELPPGLIAKFGITDLLDDPGALTRNLRAVLT
jgi:epoxyqueuosine reductase